MKIKLLENIQQIGTKLRFFKGRTYTATIATNQPKFARLTKNGLKINKVFVGRAKSDESMLVEGVGEIFEIVSFPERAEVETDYKNSKIKKPREKRVCSKGLKMREGFRPISEEERAASPNLLTLCQMGTADGKCGRAAKYCRAFNNGTVLVACCVKHGTVPENLPDFTK